MTQQAGIRSGDLILAAARIEADAAARRGDPLAALDRTRAAGLRERAATAAPEYMSQIGTGGELVPASILGECSRALDLRDTVRDPSYVTVDASRDRLELAQQAGALELALDAADTIDAENSLERMLAHQLAATHRSTMKLSAQLNRAVERMDVIHEEARERANVQATRLAGAMARLMGSYQSGLLALQRMRSGGQQVVVVQRVEVRDGGQAVVAGRVSAPRNSKRGRRTADE
jgi:hypothetical protein